MDVSRLFDRVFYLTAPPELIRKRLAAREDNPFGKNPEEVELTIEHKARMDAKAREMGFEVVDATLPLDEIFRIIVGPSKHNRA